MDASSTLVRAVGVALCPSHRRPSDLRRTPTPPSPTGQWVPRTARAEPRAGAPPGGQATGSQDEPPQPPRHGCRSGRRPRRTVYTAEPGYASEEGLRLFTSWSATTKTARARLRPTRARAVRANTRTRDLSAPPIGEPTPPCALSSSTAPQTVPGAVEHRGARGDRGRLTQGTRSGGGRRTGRRSEHRARCRDRHGEGGRVARCAREAARRGDPRHRLADLGRAPVVRGAAGAGADGRHDQRDGRRRAAGRVQPGGRGGGDRQRGRRPPRDQRDRRRSRRHRVHDPRPGVDLLGISAPAPARTTWTSSAGTAGRPPPGGPWRPACSTRRRRSPPIPSAPPS